MEKVPRREEETLGEPGVKGKAHLLWSTLGSTSIHNAVLGKLRQMVGPHRQADSLWGEQAVRQTYGLLR